MNNRQTESKIYIYIYMQILPRNSAANSTPLGPPPTTTNERSLSRSALETEGIAAA